MSIAITGAAGQLRWLVIDDLLSADIPGTDLIAIARPRPEIGHLDETDRCGHRVRRVYCRSTTRCERTQMLRSYNSSSSASPNTVNAAGPIAGTSMVFGRKPA